MKGKKEFTSAEAAKIRDLLRRKAGADRDTQKALRGKIRKIGFYITDISATDEEFLAQDFEELIARGAVAVQDDEGEGASFRADPVNVTPSDVGNWDPARRVEIAAPRESIDFSSEEGVRAFGFVGFRKVSDLQASAGREVVNEAGVYMVLRASMDEPEFVASSCGGHFKGKDPSVSIGILNADWVPRATVLYVGKAGGAGSTATLRKRLASYMRFGSGKPVGHWGGRYIWQLADAGRLLVCWRPSGPVDAAALESQLLQEFIRQYGNRPFANLRN